MEKNIELLKLNSSMFNIYFLMYIYNTKSYRSQTISNFNAWKKITTRNNSTFISSQYLFFESYFSIMKKIIHIKQFIFQNNKNLCYSNIFNSNINLPQVRFFLFFFFFLLYHEQRTEEKFRSVFQWFSASVTVEWSRGLVVTKFSSRQSVNACIRVPYRYRLCHRAFFVYNENNCSDKA